MGAALWVASALSAFVVARIVPVGRRHDYLGELIVAIVAALAFGVLASALDFGGWREPEWRAALFALLGALAAVAAYRALQVRNAT
jgi:uncharacterized membrane protein YeaQ/YmgE (transglycosylase-associated protein family)